MAPLPGTLAEIFRRGRFLKAHQLSLTCFWLLLSPPHSASSFLPSSPLPCSGGESLEAICQFFLRTDRTLSCPHCPQPPGTLSSLLLFLFPVTFAAVAWLEDWWGTAARSTQPMLAGPARASPAPRHESLSPLGMPGSPCLLFWLFR